MQNRIALIGFGEAGATFAGAGGWRSAAWDVAPDRMAAIAATGTQAASSAADALASADLVLSVVTADQALNAATSYADHLSARALWCDMTSVAPATKREAALAVEAAGGRYVDVAIMAPVQPLALAVPLLLSGPHAAEAAEALEDIGFSNVRAVGSEVGHASAIKMIRSVMIKGQEALTAEMMLAADRAGVAEDVLASLGDGWTERASYNRERMHTHGRRRAAEMEEVAKTLTALGVEPVMTRGTILRQRALGR